MENLVKSLFPRLKGKWAELNFNKWARIVKKELPYNPFLDPVLCGKWVKLLHETIKIKYSWGGYMEDRSDLWEGHYHTPGSMIHLGVDFNVPENTLVCLPKTGKLIHSELDEDQNGGWGGKIIFEIDGLYFIFGHLKHIAHEIGRTYKEGYDIGHIAGIKSNGGWYPHLHIQCMRQFNAGIDGYGRAYSGLEYDFPNPIVLKP